jgi:rubredoxin
MFAPLSAGQPALPGAGVAGDWRILWGHRQQQDQQMKKWQCVVCGFIYDEAQGWPEDGIAPGTRWEDVPADWECPDCGVGKDDFEMIEQGAD